MNITQLFHMADTDKHGTIDTIREGVEFRGTNIWLLIFAVFIASIGLNVNSTAVVIGAMLISPLMGPIAGAGMALGIYDIDLLKRSLINLGIMTGISLAVSALYFSLSPLGGTSSELLARTTPTFYDVLIAIFGGSALIVAISRKTKSSNAIAGVAIATALMPPLCTAGFGIATRNPAFFFGAIYLYLINSVFIGLSTFFFTKYLKLGKEIEQPTNLRKRQVVLSIVVVIVFIAPSIWMAWDMIQETSFRNNVDRFVASTMKFRESKVLNVEKNRKSEKPLAEVTIVGAPLSQDVVEHLGSLLPEYGLSGTELRIIQSGGARSTVSVNEVIPPVQSSAGIATGLVPPSLLNNNGSTAMTGAVPSPGTVLMSDSTSTADLPAGTNPAVLGAPGRLALLRGIENEVDVLFPNLENFSWGDLLAEQTQPLDPGLVYTVFAQWPEDSSPVERARLRVFLRLRLGLENLEVLDI